MWPPTRSTRPSPCSVCDSGGAPGPRLFAREYRGPRVQGSPRQGYLDRLDLAAAAATTDDRRLEVVVDGLPLFGGAQLAVDATLVCAQRRDGSARPHATTTDGAVVTAARALKCRTYPELVAGRGDRARLVVLAGEVDGRWSRETWSFLTLLAAARARSEPPVLRRLEPRWPGDCAELTCLAAPRPRRLLFPSSSGGLAAERMAACSRRTRCWVTRATLTCALARVPRLTRRCAWH